MADPTEKEITHAFTLLRESNDWEGRFASLPIDANCKWDDGDGPCLKDLYNVIALLCENESVEVLGLCEHHSVCMEAAIKKWRKMN